MARKPDSCFTPSIKGEREAAQLAATFVGSCRARDAGLWVVSWPLGSGTARKVELALSGDQIDNADWLLDNRHLVAAVTEADTSLAGGRLVVIDSRSNACGRSRRATLPRQSFGRSRWPHSILPPPPAI